MVRVRWPCGFCKKETRNLQSLFCETCKFWCHSECEEINDDQFESFTSSKEPYICKICRSNDTGFDFLFGLARLKTAARLGFHKLQTVAVNEKYFFTSNRLSVYPTKNLPLCNVDLTAQDLLNKFTPEYQYKAASSSADGDCLFNSVSLHLVGNESLSTELRYRTCIELVTNQEVILKHKDRGSFQLLSPDYDQCCLSCAGVGNGYSCVWTMIALANVIQIPIRSVYPLINGVKDFTSLKLNKIFNPETGLPNTEPIKVLWSHTLLSSKPKNGTWLPNHFVPLLPASAVVNNHQVSTTVSNNSSRDCIIADIRTSTPLSSPRLHSPPATPPPKHERMEMVDEKTIWTSKKRFIPKKVKLAPDPEFHVSNFESRNRFESFSESFDSVPDLDTLHSSPPLETSAFPRPKRKRVNVKKDIRTCDSVNEPSVSVPRNVIETVDVEHTGVLLDSSSSTKIDSSDSQSDCGLDNSLPQPQEVGFTGTVLKKLPNPGSVLSTEKQLQILLSADPVDRIPCGRKDDVYVVLRYEKYGQKDAFPDDRGVWDSTKGTTINHHYALDQDNHLSTLFLKDKVYCVKKLENGKTKYQKCEPQPGRTISFHRYYTKLKDDNQYRKRVTTVKNAPDDLIHLTNFAIVEYVGCKNTTGTIPHGNSNSDRGYVRTDPKILQNCVDQAKSKSPSDICFEAAKDNSVLGPKSSKQIRDKIYRDKKNKPESVKTFTNNIADEILEILKMQKTGGRIQRVEHTGGKLPNIIIYSEDQLVDIKANCLGSGGSIIGIDRTFNLGKCFVTALSYKNQSVVSRETRENPIMLGPIMLHWDGESTTYHYFFSHLRSRLGPDKVIIGTDEEKAMTKALHDVFHDSDFLLCTKHLKENLIRFLEKSGTPQRDRNRIVRAIFGNDGLVFSKNDLEFQMKKDDLSSDFAQFPRFRVYWNKFMEPKLITYVIGPLQRKLISYLWTNNNAESLNNRLKQETDWKLQNLPTLVSKLSKVSDMQIFQLRRALHGTGNWKLVNHKSEIRSDKWVEASATDKDRWFAKFLQTQKRPVNYTVVKSPDVSFTCVRPKSNSGKKPGQRRRQRSEKTRSKKLKKI